MAELTREQIHDLAHLGAQAHLAQLDMEIAAIKGAYPDLAGTPRRGRRPRKVQAVAAQEPAPMPAVKPAKRRRVHRMSAAERKAVSERMKKYWAARRKEKGK
jgi:hypothetical protein